MHQIHHTEGIVIKKIDSGEADLFITILSKDFGKFSLFAKGGKKISAKIAPHLDILNKSEISFVQGKNFARATSALTLNYFENLKSDFRRIIAGFFAMELADQAIEENAPIKKEYEEVQLFLEKLDSCKESKINYLPYIFSARFLAALGYNPQLCGQQNNETKLLRVCLEYGYDIIDKIDLSSADIRRLRVILDKPLLQIIRAPLNTWKILENVVK
ncbi:MAG: DNA repair protein RecO [bacterium]